MPYKLIFPEGARKAFEQVHQKACQVGMEKKVLAAARTIVERLETDPMGFGEPTNKLTHLNLIVWVGIIPPLIARYAVNEEHHFVYIKALVPLPGHGLS